MYLCSRFVCRPVRFEVNTRFGTILSNSVAWGAARHPAASLEETNNQQEIFPWHENVIGNDKVNACQSRNAQFINMENCLKALFKWIYFFYKAKVQSKVQGNKK